MNCFWLVALGQDSVKGTHMIDFVCWKLSYHIFSFHIWTLGISFTGGFTYSPCLVSWTRWPRTDIVFHSHSDASTVRTVGGKQPKAIFPFCQVKRSRMQHMQEQTGGKGETCYPHFSPRASKEVALTQNPRMKKFHESAIQPHISQSNKGKAPFRDCVEWIEFYWQRGSIVGGGEHVFHISHEHGAESSCCATFEKQIKTAQMKPSTLSGPLTGSLTKSVQLFCTSLSPWFSN